MKTGAVGLSFGYLTRKQRKAADGANELLAIDLFEITLTTAPSNAATRILDMKSVAVAEQAPRDQGVPTVAELRRESDRIRFELATAGIDRTASKAASEPEQAVPSMTIYADRPKNWASPHDRHAGSSSTTASGPGRGNRCWPAQVRRRTD
jgi:hypothetical protein